MRVDLFSEESIGLLLFPQPVNKDWQIVVIVELVNIHLPTCVCVSMSASRYKQYECYISMRTHIQQHEDTFLAV